MSGHWEPCPGCPVQYDGNACCGNPNWVSDEEPETIEILPKRYRITVYAGVHKVSSKVVEIDPEDYDNDEKLIGDQLEELAEEYKAEQTDVEWSPVE